MTKQDIFLKVALIIEDETEIPQEEIQEDSMLMDDLELSSLETMIIITTIEETFHIRLHEKDWWKLITVKDVVDVIYEAVE